VPLSRQNVYHHWLSIDALMLNME